MLNLLVSNTVLRHSIHIENLASNRVPIIFIILTIVALIISFIMVSHGYNFISSSLPMWLVIFFMFGMVAVFPIDGDGSTSDSFATGAPFATGDNATYQDIMLHNNYKIKSQHHLYNHYKHLLDNSHNKQDIAKYGYKTKSIKHHINHLKLYNQKHAHKVQIPYLSRFLG